MLEFHLRFKVMSAFVFIRLMKRLLIIETTHSSRVSSVSFIHLRVKNKGYICVQCLLILASRGNKNYHIAHIILKLSISEQKQKLEKMHFVLCIFLFVN